VYKTDEWLTGSHGFFLICFNVRPRGKRQQWKQASISAVKKMSSKLANPDTIISM